MAPKKKITVDPRKRRRRSESHGVLEMIRQYTPEQQSQKKTAGYTVQSSFKETVDPPPDATSILDISVLVATGPPTVVPIADISKILSVHIDYHILFTNGILEGGYSVMVHDGVSTAKVVKGISAGLPEGIRVPMAFTATITSGTMNLVLTNSGVANATVRLKIRQMEEA